MKNWLKKVVLNKYLFSVCYIVNLMLFDVGLYEIKIYNKLKWPLLIWGLLLIGYMLFYKKCLFKMEYGKLLSLFIIISALGVLLHFKSNFFTNIFVIIHTCIVLFVIFASHLEANQQKSENHLHIVLKTIQIITMCTAFLGILIAILWKNINIFGVDMGIEKGRLYGLFSNPNLTGLNAAVAIITADWIFYKCGIRNIFSALLYKIFPKFKKEETQKATCLILPKWFLIFNIIINSICLLLCDSNSAIILLSGYVLASLGIKLFLKQEHKKVSKPLLSKQILKKMSLLFSVCLLLLFMFWPWPYGVRWPVQKSFETLVNKVSVDFHLFDTGPAVEGPARPRIVLGRKNYDVTSGRFELTKQAIQVYKANPVLGIGKANIEDYGNEIIEHGLIYTDFHNAYLTLLVSSGAIGFCVFISIFILILKRLLICLFKKTSEGKNREFLCKLTAFCAAYLAYSLLEKSLIFEISFSVAFFWFAAGYAIKELLECERAYFKQTKGKKKAAAFFAISPFQMISCTNIASTLPKTERLLFTTQESEVSEKIKRSRLFAKVHLIMRENIKSFYSYAIKTLFFPKRAIIDQIPDYNYDLIFDDIYCTDCNSIICSMYLYNKKWNPELKLHLIEDGARNYCTQNDHYSKLRKVSQILGIPLYVDSFDDTIMFEPQMLQPGKDISAKKQPEFYKNQKACSIISDLYSDKIFAGEINRKDIIYFEQPIQTGASRVYQETEQKLLNLMQEILPSQSFKIKSHPRLKRENTPENKLKSSVWEPYFIEEQDKLGSLVLISLSSTALFSPKVIFNQEPTVVFLYQLFEQYFSQKDVQDEFICYQNGTFAEAVERLRNLYDNKAKVICIKTSEELHTLLTSIANGDNNLW